MFSETKINFREMTFSLFVWVLLLLFGDFDWHRPNFTPIDVSFFHQEANDCTIFDTFTHFSTTALP